jgi:hypothetical protein
MSYHLGKSILVTVTYYDVLNMPLTAFEIWKHLMVQERGQAIDGKPCTLRNVMDFLASEQAVAKISEKNGLYFLHGRENLVAERIRSEKISVSKLKRMRRLAQVLAFVPYLRMLGATGSLAMKKGTRESDWDMFVVLRSGKIWIGRTVLTGFLQLIGKRRHGKKVQDRACLNYFVTDDNLTIGTQDLFSAHEYRFLIPLLNFPLFQIFELKNRWMREYRPNFVPTTLPSLWTVRVNRRVQLVKKVVEWFCDYLSIERLLARWQTKKIRRNPKTHIEGSLIETSDHALIFLPRPRGPRVFQKFKERLSV